MNQGKEPTNHCEVENFREECYRCFRAMSVCICHRFESQVTNQTNVIVLQHHREVTHPIGTARIAKLGLRNVEIRIAHRHAKLRVDDHCLPGTALLYPSSKARSLDALSSTTLPSGLIVLDGTWSQALAMYKANVWLHALPHVVINPKSESNYRIRRQPKKGCLSTIEALVESLNSIEPETDGFDRLITVFDEMVDEQVKRANAAGANL